MITELAFTVYPVSDVPRARRFYEDLLGLKPGANWADKWVEYDLQGATFAITNMLDGHQPGLPGAAAAFEVDNFDDCFAGLRAKGVKVLLEPLTTPVCRMGAVADPDGNGIIIHQRNAR